MLDLTPDPVQDHSPCIRRVAPSAGTGQSDWDLEAERISRISTSCSRYQGPGLILCAVWFKFDSVIIFFTLTSHVGQSRAHSSTSSTANSWPRSCHLQCSRLSGVPHYFVSWVATCSLISKKQRSMELISVPTGLHTRIAKCNSERRKRKIKSERSKVLSRYFLTYFFIEQCQPL